MWRNITICTPLRDEAARLARYLAQVTALDWPAERLRVVLCEGDSADDTAAQAAAWAAEDSRVTLVHKHTGRPFYGSVVRPERFEVLATVFNAMLDTVDYGWTAAVLVLPADIVYQPDLLRRLAMHEVDIVAPLVFQDDLFYDIWAFSQNGHDWPAFRRDQTARVFGQGLQQMGTVGGTVLIGAHVLRAGVRYSPVNVDRGFCEQARALGFGVWCDPTTWVEHFRRA